MRLASAGDIPAIGDVSARTASNWVKREDFPAPLDVTAAGPIWSREAVERWCREDRPNPKGGRPKVAA